MKIPFLKNKPITRTQLISELGKLKPGQSIVLQQGEWEHLITKDKPL